MKNFLFNNPTTIFILVLFILLVILWFPFICCVCCKKCLCVPKILLKHSKYFTIGCILLCLAICIICLVGYFKNSNIFHGKFGLGCSVLKIGFHLIDGDEYKVKPYWSGITSITDKLNNTKTNIVNLLEITPNMNKEIILVNQKFIKFENNLVNEYNIRYEEIVDNPEPGEESFIPEYLESYGPPNVEGTTLGEIRNELKIYKPYTLGIFRSILTL